MDLIERYLAAIRRNYDSSIKRGRLTPEAVEQRLAAIEGQVGYDGCAAADVVRFQPDSLSFSISAYAE